MNVRDFPLRDPLAEQLRLDVVVDVKLILRRRTEVAEHELRQTGLFRLLPYLVHVFHTGVHLAPRLVGVLGVDEALIQSDFSPVRGYFQQVVLIRLHLPLAHLLRPLGKTLHQFFLNLARFHCHVVEDGLRALQVQRVRRLDVGRVLEHSHQLRQVEKLRESVPRLVPRPLRRKLYTGRDLAEHRGPTVEVPQVHLLQPVLLKVTHHREQLRHGVRHRRSGREDHPLPSGQLVHVMAFHLHIRGLLRLRLRNTGYVLHLRVKEKVFVVVRLVHKQPVHAKLLERHDVVLARLVVQLLQFRLQAFLRLFQLFDLKPARVFHAGHLAERLGYLLYLALDEPALALLGEGYLLELAVTDDDRVVVAGGYAGAEFLPILGLEVLFRRHEDVGGRVQPQELAGGLLRQVVGDDEKAFMAQAEPLCLHCGGGHLIGFPSADRVSQQRVPAVENPGDGGGLVFAKGRRRGHAGEGEVAPVVFPRPRGVEERVVPLHKDLTPFRVFEYPLAERLFDRFLPRLGKHRFLVVEFASLPAFSVPLDVVYADVLEVQSVFNEFIGVDARRSVGDVRFHVVHVGILAGYMPFAGVFGVLHSNVTPQTLGSIEKLVHELLDVFWAYPCRAQSHVNIPRFNSLGLGFFERRHVDGEDLRFTSRSVLGERQFLPNVAGEVLVGGLIEAAPLGVLFLGTREDGAFQLLDNLLPLHAGEFGHVVEVYPRPLGEGDGEGLGGGIDGLRRGVAPDGALGEDVGLAFEFAVLVQNLQGAEQGIRAVLLEKSRVCPAVDKSITGGEAVVGLREFRLALPDNLVGTVLKLNVDEGPDALFQLQKPPHLLLLGLRQLHFVHFEVFAEIDPSVYLGKTPLPNAGVGGESLLSLLSVFPFLLVPVIENFALEPAYGSL